MKRCSGQLGRVVAAAVLVTLPALGAVLAQSQVSAIAGATFSTLRGVDGLDRRTGLIGGLSIVLPSSGITAFQPEVLLVSKGAKGTNSGPDGLKLNYVEVPLLFRLSLDTGAGMVPFVYAGPYLGFQIDCKVQGVDADCADAPGVSTRTVDIGGAFGGGLGFDLGGALLTTGVRYSFGVSKIADFDVGNVRESAKNGSFALYAGLGFRIGER
ncbi:MAG: PorT family protein [Gemmatimonadaceae bacterium]|nr:PorT family protein [Gemmatimonadaceae bacterium]